jgi:hypothetical protein
MTEDTAACLITLPVVVFSKAISRAVVETATVFEEFRVLEKAVTDADGLQGVIHVLQSRTSPVRTGNTIGWPLPCSMHPHLLLQHHEPELEFHLRQLCSLPSLLQQERRPLEFLGGCNMQ